MDSVILLITSFFRNIFLFELLDKLSFGFLITFILTEICRFQLLVKQVLLLKSEDQTLKILEDFAAI